MDAMPVPEPEQTLLRCAEDGTPQGHASRAACHAGDGLLHRAVFLVLADSDGRLLLQRRRSALWDGRWDFAGATHPLATKLGDESDDEAAARCLRDEWGVDAALTARFAFVYHARDGARSEREYCVVYTGVVGSDLAPSAEHAYAHEWEVWSTLARRMDDDPDAFTPWAHAARPKLEAHPEWRF
jgi:isopentenyl-diphosphate delta-isomerase